MPVAYLGIGTNMGDRLAFLQGALDGLRADAAVDVDAWSPVYETRPVGGPPQENYLNAVVAVATSKNPPELLALCNALEADADRVRTVHWGPRTLDIDVLLYENLQCDDPVLTIPHPRMHERAFVLVPLRDLAPELAQELAANAELFDDPTVARYDGCLK